MRILLYILAALAFLAGYAIFDSSKSAIHEIAAFVLFIVTAVLFSGAAIIGAINRITKRIEANAPTPETHVTCPDCKELVLTKALVCKHCGCKLIPQS